MQSSNIKKSIGGYFELELQKGSEYHLDSLSLNTGRNAFEYILLAKEYSKIFLPYYICNTLLEPIQKLNIDYEFYHIDDIFNPILNTSNFRKEDALLYVNYFGVCDSIVEHLEKRNVNLIIDNSQAFFSKPLMEIDTFYSARKFFGVPDGAYLYTNKHLENNFEKDISYNRFDYLLGRIDLNAEQFFKNFLEQEEALANQNVRTMSNITKRVLNSINYAKISKARKENFLFLHDFLKNSNSLSSSIECFDSTPMIYPYLIENGKSIKEKLLANQIYVPTYWNEVTSRVKQTSWENHLTNNLVALPINQNMELENLTYIKEKILNI